MRMSLGWALVGLGCGHPLPGPTGPEPASAPTAASTTSPVASRIPAAPRSASATPPSPEQALGAAFPFVLEAASPDGQWVVICQARADTDGDGKVEVRVGPRGELQGDRLESYLVNARGVEVAVDDLLAFDPTGRWLVTQEGGRARLRDTHEGRAIDITDLGADVDRDTLAYLPHRSLSFDARGSRFLYARRVRDRTEVVVRELDSDRETTIDPGPGALWRVELDSSGQWVILSMIPQDSNQNGRLDWPVPRATANRPRCAGPVPRAGVWGQRGDRTRLGVVRASGGRIEWMTSPVTPLGRDLVWREPGGRLLVGDPQGKSQELVSGECDARIVHPDSERGLVLAVCTRGPGKPRLGLFGRGLRLDLGLEMTPPSLDAPSGDNPRLFAVYPGKDAALVDLERKKLHRLEPGDAVLGVGGSRVILRRRGALWLVEVTTGATTKLGDLGPELGDWVTNGAVTVAGSLVVDVDLGQVLGRVSRRPLAVTRSGRVLVALGHDADAQAIAVGPLAWMRPE
jgi:hypothetical protein